LLCFTDNMPNETLIKIIGRIKAVFRRISLSGRTRTSFFQREKIGDFQLPEDLDFCHKDKVHIFVRGLADGKLHSARHRNYSDFRFYKKDNLKVFCAVCRKRIF